MLNAVTLASNILSLFYFVIISLFFLSCFYVLWTLLYKMNSCTILVLLSVLTHRIFILLYITLILQTTICSLNKLVWAVNSFCDETILERNDIMVLCIMLYHVLHCMPLLKGLEIVTINFCYWNNALVLVWRWCILQAVVLWMIFLFVIFAVKCVSSRVLVFLQSINWRGDKIKMGPVSDWMLSLAP